MPPLSEWHLLIVFGLPIHSIGQGTLVFVLSMKGEISHYDGFTTLISSLNGPFVKGSSLGAFMIVAGIMAFESNILTI